MEKIYEFLIQKSNQGKIEKQTVIELIKLLKDEKIHYAEDIAIIGLDLRFPMADSIESFWYNLKEKYDCISEFPESRKSDILPFIGNQNFAFDVGAYLTDVDKFDYDLFKLSPKEASLMDPNQRLFLEVAWHTFENAGYGGFKLKGKNVGVFIGDSSDYDINYRKLINLGEETNGMDLSGNLKSIIASRISYILDLNGPALLIDTACSSSLVAVHLACQSINSGECDLVLAGGIKINLLPLKIFDGMGIRSLDGKTKTFDENSNGYGIGEGVAAVLLKPLKKAVEDNDFIYAVIKGSACNQDGTSIGITAPNPNAQCKMLSKAWENAKVNAETITYIEAHGTGTKLGDPIEVEAIDMAFRKHTNKKQFCAIGSLKTNIGHLDNAAGIAGLIKIVLALKHKEIPPLLHFQKPNGKINFLDSPVYVNDRLCKWETNGHPRRCGVSAFGLSGTNCHLVLEEAPERKEITGQHHEGKSILTISSQYQQGITKLVKSYMELINNDHNIDLNNLCITANTGRGHYSHRLIVIFKDTVDLKHKLESIMATESLESAAIKDVYFGRHKIVASNKEYRAEGEFTENEIQAINNSINSKIKDLDPKNDLKSQNLLEEICFSYVQGAEIDWSELYKGKKYQKISLPTYPFQKKRCWVEIMGRTDKVRFNQLTGEKDTYYNIAWVPCDMEKEEFAQKKGSILIFKEQNSLAETIIKALKDQGKEIIEVYLGEKYCQIDNNTYTIENTEDSYKKLIANIKEYSLSQIIHLQTLSNNQEIENIHQLEEFQQKGVYSLFYLTRALLSNRVKEDLDIVLISDYVHEVTKMEEIINPGQASLFGLGKVVIQEYPKFRCRCIDIDRNTSVNEIILELEYGNGVYQVAYRNGRRFVEEFQELDLNNLSDQDIRIQSEGVYLITGGAGGIGLEIGKYLATKNKAKLALLNRSILPERKTWDEIIAKKDDRKLINKITAIQEMEKAGGQVSYYSVDVSNYGEVKLILDELRQKYGKINGIIHSAGVAGDGFIINKDEKVFQTVLAPKIQGTWLLDKLTEKDNLDFFIMFSSITSLLGGPGQGDYTAANAFLDTYASYRNKKGRKTLTINWPAWKETGMAVDYGANMDGTFKTISTKEALHGFSEVLKKNITKVFIVEINSMSESAEQFPIAISREIKAALQPQNRNSITQQSIINKKDVVIKGKADNNYTYEEKELSYIWAEILGLDEIDIYDNFYELGGNSISALAMTNIINKRLNKNINISDFYEYLKIHALAGFLAGQAKNSGETESETNRELNRHIKNLTCDKDNALFLKVNEDNHNESIFVDCLPQIKLSSIEPFNSIFYRDCFYNAYFPIVNYFNKNMDLFFANDINYYYRSRKDLNLKVEFISLKDFAEMQREIGLNMDVSSNNDEIVYKTVKSLSKNRPVILLIDCFFENIREDMFHKNHWPHFLIVYGYDMERRIFHIIEHDNVNSLTYKKCEIDFEVLKECYDGYTRYFGVKDESRFFEFYLYENIQDNKDIQLNIAARNLYITNLISSKQIIYDGISQLKSFIMEFSDLARSDKLMEKINIDTMIINISNIILAKESEVFKSARLLGGEVSLFLQNEDIASKWSLIRSILEKYRISLKYKKDSVETIIQNLEAIVDLENKYYENVYKFIESAYLPLTVYRDD